MISAAKDWNLSLLGVKWLFWATLMLMNMKGCHYSRLTEPRLCRFTYLWFYAYQSYAYLPKSKSHFTGFVSIRALVPVIIWR